MSMNLVVLGLPGAGKGTQAGKISEAYDVPHISMGDILRNNKSYETESDKTVGEIIDAGNVVPVKTVATLLKERVEQPDCAEGYVIDGFPRNREQAEITDDLIDLDAIIYIQVDEENIMERLTLRRICEDCGESFHKKYKPAAVEGTCDKCGGNLYQREDDTEEKIAERISWQRDGIAEIKDFYAGTGLIHEIDGNQSIDAVWDDVQALIEDVR